MIVIDQQILASHILSYLKKCTKQSAVVALKSIDKPSTYLLSIIAKLLGNFFGPIPEDRDDTEDYSPHIYHELFTIMPSIKNI